MKISINPIKIKEVLNRGVENIYPSKEIFEGVLMSGKKLKIYNGIDPTGKLHIGHLVVLRKLRQLQELGHDIIVLFGGFTASIGDPTGKDSTRKPLTRAQIVLNAKDYKEQIKKFFGKEKLNIRFFDNEEWTNKLKPKDLLDLASNFTVARLLERDMFQKRIKEGKDIHLNEFLYPIFQAYDSLTMDVDLEIGGSDQTFNMLAGRTLIKKLKNKEKFVLTTKLLTDSEGKKMGKTEGNMVNLDEPPGQMYGKIMSWPDGLIIQSLELCTDIPMDEIQKIESQIKEGKLNPKIAKERLAAEIVAICHSKTEAKEAAEEFNNVFKEKKLPSDITEVKITQKTINILDFLVAAKLVSSKAEAKRMVIQGGVKIDGVVKKEWQGVVEIKKGLIVQVGKRRFVKIA
ncbi:MAG: tyrosine--tRNA ligase [bacterium]|nr:tyrosine--tRNA ligase [bacterium]